VSDLKLSGGDGSGLLQEAMQQHDPLAREEGIENPHLMPAHTHPQRKQPFSDGFAGR